MKSFLSYRLPRHKKGYIFDLQQNFLNALKVAYSSVLEKAFREGDKDLLIYSDHEIFGEHSSMGPVPKHPSHYILKPTTVRRFYTFTNGKEPLQICLANLEEGDRKGFREKKSQIEQRQLKRFQPYSLIFVSKICFYRNGR